MNDYYYFFFFAGNSGMAHVETIDMRGLDPRFKKIIRATGVGLE
jgi:hypothetical protein